MSRALLESLRIKARDLAMLPSLPQLTNRLGLLRLVSPIGGETIAVRELGGQLVTVRRRTSDRATFVDVFRDKPHLPLGLPGDLSLIWDLGANIGLTMASYAHRFPGVRVVGVELDAGNAAVARHNTAAWRERCEVIVGAVWTDPGTIGIKRTVGHESGFRIERDGSEAQVVTLNDLIRTTGVPDLVKMDIEGAERQVLSRHVEWAAHVPAILVECHADYTPDLCGITLSALGFKPRILRPKHGRASVFATR